MVEHLGGTIKDVKQCLLQTKVLRQLRSHHQARIKNN